MQKIYFIVPAYNEAEVIKAVLEEVLSKYDNVVCIDDGSHDGTKEQIAQTQATLVSHSINLGQGAALQTGIEYALQDGDAEIFVTYDADGQHRLNDVSKMIATLKKTNVDIVLGSRFLGEKADNINFSKRLLLKAAILFTNKTTGLRLTDSHNGLRVFNRDFAENLRLTFSDMTHASEVIDRIREYNFSYTEVPVKIKYTPYSKAKGQSMINAINIAIDSSLHKVTRK